MCTRELLQPVLRKVVLKKSLKDKSTFHLLSGSKSTTWQGRGVLEKQQNRIARLGAQKGLEHEHSQAMHYGCVGAIPT